MSLSINIQPDSNQNVQLATALAAIRIASDDRLDDAMNSLAEASVSLLTAMHNHVDESEQENAKIESQIIELEGREREKRLADQILLKSLQDELNMYEQELTRLPDELSAATAALAKAETELAAAKAARDAALQAEAGVETRQAYVNRKANGG